MWREQPGSKKAARGSRGQENQAPDGEEVDVEGRRKRRRARLAAVQLRANDFQLHDFQLRVNDYIPLPNKHLTKAEVERKWRVDAWGPAARSEFDARCAEAECWPSEAQSELGGPYVAAVVDDADVHDVQKVVEGMVDSVQSGRN